MRANNTAGVKPLLKRYLLSPARRQRARMDEYYAEMSERGVL